MISTMTVSEFVNEYEFRGDADYTPNDHEKTLIEDAIHGWIASQEEALPVTQEGTDDR